MELYGVEIASRLLLGTAQYPSPAILADAVRASKADIVTVSLRRESGRLREGQDFWALIRALGIRVLAQYRRLPFGQGGGHHGANGA